MSDLVLSLAHSFIPLLNHYHTWRKIVYFCYFQWWNLLFINWSKKSLQAVMSAKSQTWEEIGMALARRVDGHRQGSHIWVSFGLHSGLKQITILYQYFCMEWLLLKPGFLTSFEKSENVAIRDPHRDSIIMGPRSIFLLERVHVNTLVYPTSPFIHQQNLPAPVGIRVCDSSFVADRKSGVWSRVNKGKKPFEEVSGDQIFQDQ